MELPVTWTFVWQGAVAELEPPEDNDRVWIKYSGEWWASKLDPCPGHVLRLHPREDFTAYCTLCGEEDLSPWYGVTPEELAEATERRQRVLDALPLSREDPEEVGDAEPLSQKDIDASDATMKAVGLDE